MYTSLNVIVSTLKNLRKSVSNKNIIEKVFQCLGPEWHPKVTAIQEAHDLEKLSLDKVLKSLMTQELNMRRQEEIRHNKPKDIALKASKCEEFETKSSDLNDKHY